MADFHDKRDGIIKRIGNAIKGVANGTGASYEKQNPNYKGLYSKNPKKQQKAAEMYNNDRRRRGLVGENTYNDYSPNPDSKPTVAVPPHGSYKQPKEVQRPPGY